MSPEIKSPDIQNPEATLPDPSASGELHGATYIDEWTAMPQTEDSLSHPTQVEGPTPVEPELARQSSETNENIEERGDRLRIRALGAVAAVKTVSQAVKGRFVNVATRFRVWKNTTTNKQPSAQTSAGTTVEAPATHQIVSAATEAKGEGDWMGYQRELLKFAEVADQTQEDQTLGKEALRSRVSRADAKVEATEAPARMTEEQYKAEQSAREEAQALQQKREDRRAKRESAKARRELKESPLVDPSNVLDLRKQIDEAVAKRMADATFAGNNTLIGHDRDTVTTEVTEKMLQDYFGATESDLKRFKGASKKAQSEVARLLKLSRSELEELSNAQANDEVPVAPGNVYSINRTDSVSDETGEHHEPTVWQERLAQRISADRAQIEEAEKAKKAA